MDFGYILINGYFECFNTKYFDRELLRALKRLEEEGFQNDEVIDNFQVVIDEVRNLFISEYQEEKSSLDRFFRKNQYSESISNDKLIFKINTGIDFIEACEGIVIPNEFNELSVDSFSLKPDLIYRKGITKISIANEITMHDIELIQKTIDKIKQQAISTDNSQISHNSDKELNNHSSKTSYNDHLSYWDIIIDGYIKSYNSDHFLDYLLRECRRAEKFNYSREEFFQKIELVIESIIALTKRIHRKHINVVNAIKKPKFPYLDINKKTNSWNSSYTLISYYDIQVNFDKRDIRLTFDDIENIRNSYIEFSKLMSFDKKHYDRLAFLYDDNINSNSDIQRAYSASENEDIGLVYTELINYFSLEESANGPFFVNEEEKLKFINNLSHVIVLSSFDESADNLVYLASKKSTAFGKFLGIIHTKFRKQGKYLRKGTRESDSVYFKLMRTVDVWKDVKVDSKLKDKLK
ncbi:hypothetical protein ACP6L2_03800 [Sphingobacterium lactis]|uniref:hypothetical protein n=1 Tax=Sphingobacterium lactis TaxID=797291 RepID=UPI003F7EC359